MRKESFIVLISLFIFLTNFGSVFAIEPYGQFDILINRPVYMGATNLNNEFEGFEDVNDFLKQYPIIVPDLRGHVFINTGPMRVGIGARGFSAIIETILWPTLTAEIDIKSFRFSGSIGGGLFMFLGLFNDIEADQIWLPELTTAYMFNDWFHLGISGTGVYLPKESSDSLGFICSIFVRFSIGGED